ncbi:DUF1361 domain-containing protein [uncultured Spirosoma sp.]|uniref:DUF1361 domain-containing protein n=1 Tax=uncultured Spirosoma sp. TaxID=278208 RepID=UPI00259056DE|nr:DUF1361 domain-containing protein [uncultured Spirosoma sp.]
MKANRLSVLQRYLRRSNRGLTALTGLTLAGIGLTIARGLITDNWWFFIMLTWNLFLAWFPLGVVLVLRDLRAAAAERPLFGSTEVLLAGLTVWLAFLPNAPYIITDLFHIQHVPMPLLWFDTMTIFLFAMTGLLCGLYSVLLVHRLLRPLLGTTQTWIVTLSCQFLSGFGIYLGRFGRWNSWNVLSSPVDLLQAIVHAYRDHLSIKLTLAYGFVLVVLYVAFWWHNEQDEPVLIR